MTSFFLCCVAFVFSYVAARRSLVAGLATVVTVGYAYGILRANITEPSSHFIFDAAVLGLYLAQLAKPAGRGWGGRRTLALWVGALAAWPLLLFFAPVQDYAVQLVGLRGNVFLLPLVLLGARLTGEDVKRLALAFAALNLIAFGFAAAEFVLGVERFYPRNAVTELIYNSVVDENFLSPDRSTALRIPATFTSAHAFAGTLVLTFPFLFGLWALKGARPAWQDHLLKAALGATLLGVFMAAARQPFVVLALLLGVSLTLAAGRLHARSWALWVVMLAGIGWTVSSEARLQRFMTLRDTDYVSDRVSWSVNESFFELAVEYPMGNGLGGGGTSMPYFLQGRINPPRAFMENEYARIVLEQGVFGLCLWAGFIVWVFARRAVRRTDEWHVGRRLLWVACAAFFMTGMIGTGLLTSIPGTAIVLVGVGWVAVRQPRAAESRASAAPAESGAAPAPELVRQYG
ncbi:MAG TPA: hypothetical protein VG148_13045 [Pyrinomonadaceae bacterium]|nr:hypothetical protein [Pyrinomonadaceae bacterium]